MARKKTSEKICITFFKKIQSNAIKRGLTFDLDIDYLWNLFLKQNKKCALTGIDINIVNATISNNYHLNTASLDRIDSSKGYEKNNIRWVHKAINHLKSDINDDDLIYLCHLIVNSNPNYIQTDINHINIAKKRSISSDTIQKMKNANPHKKSILQYDLKNNLIKEWDSINEARDFYKYKSEMGIIGTCKGRQNSSGGFIWKYKEI
jgi:hypothetical protein